MTPDIDIAWRGRKAVFRGVNGLWKTPSPFAMTPRWRDLDVTHWSPVAQLVEQAAVNRWVAGSSSARGAKSFQILSP